MAPLERLRSSAYASLPCASPTPKDRYASRPDQETRQDQSDPEDPLPLDEQNDAHDDEDHREYPKQSWTHGDSVPNRASANSGLWTQRRVRGPAGIECATLHRARSRRLLVFAPVNDAFAALPAGTLDTLLLPENEDQLTAVLTYHVVPQQAMSDDLTDGMTITTVQGQPLTVGVSDTGVTLTDTNGNAVSVVQADIEAGNGVVHVIDGVLLPAAG